MTRVTVKHGGMEVEPHFHAERAEPDRFAKRGGCRVTPPGPGHNESGNGACCRSLEDVAEHLRANPKWGVRMMTSKNQTDIFIEDVPIDGKPR